MDGSRWRFWVEQLLSKKSLLTAGAAAVGLVGWAATHHPTFGWLMLGGGGAWTALMYYVGAAHPDDPLARRRAEAVREVEQALRQVPPPRDEDARARWREREAQLRRILELYALIRTDLPATPSGVSLLSPEQEVELSEFVDQAIEQARRRVLLLRAIRANPAAQLESELRDLIARRQRASARVRDELDELIASKREQAARIQRWHDDLHLAEINLDQIETFLRAVAYDQAVTPTNVGDRINRLKVRVQARRESVEELERRINESVS
jgi:hypothetical protein